jgi:hypothetical protein
MHSVSICIVTSLCCGCVGFVPLTAVSRLCPDCYNNCCALRMSSLFWHETISCVNLLYFLCLVYFLSTLYTVCGWSLLVYICTLCVCQVCFNSAPYHLGINLFSWHDVVCVWFVMFVCCTVYVQLVLLAGCTLCVLGFLCSQSFYVLCLDFYRSMQYPASIQFVLLPGYTLCIVGSAVTSLYPACVWFILLAGYSPLCVRFFILAGTAPYVLILSSYQTLYVSGFDVNTSLNSVRCRGVSTKTLATKKRQDLSRLDLVNYKR